MCMVVVRCCCCSIWSILVEWCDHRWCWHGSIKSKFSMLNWVPLIWLSRANICLYLHRIEFTAFSRYIFLQIFKWSADFFSWIIFLVGVWPHNYDVHFNLIRQWPCCSLVITRIYSFSTPWFCSWSDRYQLAQFDFVIGSINMVRPLNNFFSSPHESHMSLKPIISTVLILQIINRSYINNTR